MKTSLIKLCFVVLAFISTLNVFGWEGMPMPQLHVDGRYLKDPDGKIVNLKGFAQTYSPFFNSNAWNNYDVVGCLNYNKWLIDEMLAAEWKMSFMRLHMDPYWSNTPGCTGRYEGEECFDEARFRNYLDKVFVPMAEYCISKGLYVVMRPPGVFPNQISVGDGYNEYLKTVWGIVSNHPKLKNNPNIMFELGNEPIDILGTDGTYGAGGDAKFENLQKYMQSIVDVIRGGGANNILWVPGLGYQSSYAGFPKYPIIGNNIGYAIHVYPGWFGSANGYLQFQREWDKSVKPIADIAPVMVTEMDWAPAKYKSSWGKSNTGIVGGDGFGANFKYITDNSGNVSWLLFTDVDKLAQFVDAPPATGDTCVFLNDPEACPWQAFHWFKEYANPTNLPITKLEVLNSNLTPIVDNVPFQLITGGDTYVFVKATYDDGHIEYVSSKATYQSNNATVATGAPGRLIAKKDGTANITISYGGLDKQISVVASTFPLKAECMDLNMWGANTFDNSTHTLHITQWGQAGWTFTNGVDITGYKYLVFKFGTYNYPWGTNIHLKDGSTESQDYTWQGKKQLIIDLQNVKTSAGASIIANHITAVRIWSAGGDIVIDNVYLTNKSDASEETSSIDNITIDKLSGDDIVDVHTVTGVLVKSHVKRSEAKLGLSEGVYIIGHQKVIVMNRGRFLN